MGGHCPGWGWGQGGCGTEPKPYSAVHSHCLPSGVLWLLRGAGATTPRPALGPGRACRGGEGPLFPTLVSAPGAALGPITGGGGVWGRTGGGGGGGGGGRGAEGEVVGYQRVI